MTGVAQLAYFTGLLFLSGGMIAYFRGVGLCNRIVGVTSNRPDSLRPIEIWLNIYQARKRRKLRLIVETESPKSELHSWASTALKLEGLFYGLFASGNRFFLLRSLN